MTQLPRNKGCPEETKARLQGTQGSVGAKLDLDPNWTPPGDADWVPPGSHIENGAPHHSQNNGKRNYIPGNKYYYTGIVVN